MTNKEAREILNELNAVNPEHLNDEAKRLLDAIMTIADKRDVLIEENEAVWHRNAEIEYELEKCRDKLKENKNE